MLIKINLIKKLEIKQAKRTKTNKTLKIAIKSVNIGKKLGTPGIKPQTRPMQKN